jgi:predicted transcriptional regulator
MVASGHPAGLVVCAGFLLRCIDWEGGESATTARRQLSPRRGVLFSVFVAYISSPEALPLSRFVSYSKAMEVHFTPEQEMQLSEIATHAGIDAERLVKDAALRLLQEEARFRAAVREGIAQADRGEFIEEEEMDARLEQMLRS